MLAAPLVFMHVAIYNVINACGLFRHIRSCTRRGMRGGGAARRYFSVQNCSLLDLVNACSFLSKCELISSLIVDSRLDLLAVTETWLNIDNGDFAIKSACPDGYTDVQAPRLNRKCGGLVLIFKTSIDVRRQPTVRCESFELLDLNINSLVSRLFSGFKEVGSYRTRSIFPLTTL